MALAEISIVPVGTDDASFSDYVAGCCKVLDEAGDVRYQVTPTATVIEGDFERVFQAVKKMHQAPFDKGCVRVITSITIDERRDKPSTMETTVEAVMEDLQ